MPGVVRIAPGDAAVAGGRQRVLVVQGRIVDPDEDVTIRQIESTERRSTLPGVVCRPHRGRPDI